MDMFLKSFDRFIYFNLSFVGTNESAKCLQKVEPGALVAETGKTVYCTQTFPSK